MTDVTRRDLMKGMALASALGIKSRSTVDRDADAPGISSAYNVAGSLYVGPRSSVESTTPDDGRLYIPTDSDAMYAADGTRWGELDPQQAESESGVSISEMWAATAGSTVTVTNDGGTITVEGPSQQHYQGSDGLEAIKTAINTEEKAVVVQGDTIGVDITDDSQWMTDPSNSANTHPNQVVFGWETETSLYCAPNTWIRVDGAPPGGRNIFFIRPSNVGDIEVDVNVDGNAWLLGYDNDGATWDNKILVLVSIGHHKSTPRTKLTVRAENFNYFEESDSDDDLAGVAVQTGLNGGAVQVSDSYFRHGDCALWLTKEYDGTRADDIVDEVHVTDCGRGSETHSQRAVYVEAGNKMTVSNLTIANSKNPLTIFDIGSLAGDTSHVLFDGLLIRDGTGSYGMHIGGSSEATAVEVNDFIVDGQDGHGAIVSNVDNVHFSSGRIESAGENGLDVREGADWVGISGVDLVGNAEHGFRGLDAQHLSLSDVRAIRNGGRGIGIQGDIDATLDSVHAWNNDQNDDGSPGFLLEGHVSVVTLTAGDDQGSQTQNVGVDSGWADDVRVTAGRILSNQSVSFTVGDELYNVIGVDLPDVEEGVLVDGQVAESANATSPQGSYPMGTWVTFTNTGSGGGDGWYVANGDGTFGGPV